MRETRQLAESAQSAAVRTAGILVATASRLAVAVGSARTAEPEAVGGAKRLHRHCQVKLFPDRIGQLQPVFVMEGHVHVGRLESALPAGKSRGLGGSGQVHQIECLIDGQCDRAETADAFEAQLSGETGHQAKSVTFESIDTAAQAETANDLELRFRDSEGFPPGRDGDPGAVRRYGGQIDTQGGGVVWRGQGRRILPSGRTRTGAC